MASTVFVTLEEALYLHATLIHRFGGDGGLRDAGLLESALARPRSGYYRSLSEQAAALLHSLARNHAFVDGNKRVAFATTAVFLRLNGFRLVCTPDEAERFLIDKVIAGAAAVTQIARTLEGWMQPL